MGGWTRLQFQKKEDKSSTAPGETFSSYRKPVQRAAEPVSIQLGSTGAVAGAVGSSRRNFGVPNWVGGGAAEKRRRVSV